LSKLAPAVRITYERRRQGMPSQAEEGTMRKIVAWLISSLDGVVESPESWSSPYMNEEVNARIGAEMAPAGSVLLGRRTYQEMAAFWPQQDGNPFADYLNNSTKYVVSATLDTLEWANSRLVTGDIAEEVAALKQQPAEDLLVLGSPTLVRSLLRLELLDEVTLNICPIVLGSGLRLFDGSIDQLPLELVESTAYGTGVLRVSYQPAKG
jgi:dihydrofolate reductase